MTMIDPPPRSAHTPRMVADQTAPGEAFLRVEEISKSFGGVQALSSVSFSVHAGGLYHLMGENGSGKSTLIKIISGVQAPDSGRLVIAGTRHARLHPLESIRLGIETVYQDLSLFQNLSVMENVALNSQLLRHNGRLGNLLDRRALRRVATEALEQVGLPADEDFLDRRIETLPIALRQLVAIARGIATRASLVIMDEPTTALTQREVDNLIEIVTRLKNDGVAVIFVSHKLDEVFRIGGEVIVMRDGRLITEGPLGKFTPESLSYHMTGRRLPGARYRQEPTPGDLLLEVKNLRVTGHLHGVSFRLRAGEILGVTGLLDSGRNELARALAGVQPMDAGELHLSDQPIRLRSPQDAIRHGIGYVPEDRLSEGLFANRSVRDNIVVAILERLRGRFGQQLDQGRMRQVAETYVGRLNIATPSTALPVQSLSGGNQQRVLISRWLAIEPRLLILHGPTMGVDVGSKDALYRVIQRLAHEGLGIIIVSDDLPELLQNCDKIMVLKRGVITAERAATSLNDSELAQILLEASPDRADA